MTGRLFKWSDIKAVVMEKLSEDQHFWFNAVLGHLIELEPNKTILQRVLIPCATRITVARPDLNSMDFARAILTHIPDLVAQAERNRKMNTSKTKLERECEILAHAAGEFCRLNYHLRNTYV